MVMDSNGNQNKNVVRLSEDELDVVSGGRYVPGMYKKEAAGFLKSSLGEELYSKIMSHGSGKRYPYVAAKIYLSGSDWEKYVWIEHHGSLEGFPE